MKEFKENKIIEMIYQIVFIIFISIFIASIFLSIFGNVNTGILLLLSSLFLSGIIILITSVFSKKETYTKNFINHIEQKLKNNYDLKSLNELYNLIFKNAIKNDVIFLKNPEKIKELLKIINERINTIKRYHHK